MTVNEIHQRFLSCSGVCTDTRKIVPGSLFVALKGPNFNANAFAADALSAGCRYALVDDPGMTTDERFMLVPDTLKTLQELALYHRSGFTIPVIGLTGSNGKTTTKELIHAVLQRLGPCLATTGNLNNHIGVPLTLLRLSKEHRFAIIEMGANKPGDIAELCAIADPDHGMITNIGAAHLEGFGDINGVLRTKTELYAHLRARGGKVFVNADDAPLMEKSKGIDRSTYGSRRPAELIGTLGTNSHTLRFSWEYEGAAQGSVSTALFGSYNLMNALAAARIGKHFGASAEQINEALAAYEPTNDRSQWVRTGRNEVIKDAYNANPTSVLAALNGLSAMAGPKRKWAILGDMFELGAHSAKEHQRVAEHLEQLDVRALLIGPEYTKAAAGLDLLTFATTEDAATWLQDHAIQDALILVKGSRGMKLEKLYGLL